MKPSRVFPQERLRSLPGGPSEPANSLSGHPAKSLQSFSSQELLSDHINNMSDGRQSLSWASHEALEHLSRPLMSMFQEPPTEAL
eukprot:9270327-Pyramimonas_sp.AAC.2